jgi:hypothetical protein
MNTTDNQYAVSSVRDQFLVALDGDDIGLSTRLAQGLIRCGNPLPSSTCRELGLPVGSSYGRAAREVIRQNGQIRPARPAPGATAPCETQTTMDRLAEDPLTAA